MLTMNVGLLLSEMPNPVSLPDDLELYLNHCTDITLNRHGEARTCHRFLFEPTFRAKSILEFEVDVVSPSVLLIVPSNSAATAHLSGFEIIEPLSPDHVHRLAKAVEELCSHELPDIYTNSRDGIMVYYRLDAHGESRGFDAFNPDIELHSKHCDWVAIALSLAVGVLSEDKAQRYLAELQTHFVSP